MLNHLVHLQASATHPQPLAGKSRAHEPQLAASGSQQSMQNLDSIWDAVLPRTPPAPTPNAMPGMFCNEQYTPQQKHALFIFRYLLVFVAALESFAHGANDTGNATGMHKRSLRAPCQRRATLASSASFHAAIPMATCSHSELCCLCRCLLCCVSDLPQWPLLL